MYVGHAICLGVIEGDRRVFADSVLREMAGRGIGIEVNPTSNLSLGTSFFLNFFFLSPILFICYLLLLGSLFSLTPALLLSLLCLCCAAQAALRHSTMCGGLSTPVCICMWVQTTRGSSIRTWRARRRCCCVHCAVNDRQAT